MSDPIAARITQLIAEHPDATNETLALLIAAQNAAFGVRLPTAQELEASVLRLEAARQAGRELRVFGGLHGQEF